MMGKVLDKEELLFFYEKTLFRLELNLQFVQAECDEFNEIVEACLKEYENQVPQFMYNTHRTYLSAKNVSWYFDTCMYLDFSIRANRNNSLDVCRVKPKPHITNSRKYTSEFSYELGSIRRLQDSNIPTLKFEQYSLETIRPASAFNVYIRGLKKRIELLNTYFISTVVLEESDLLYIKNCKDILEKLKY